MFREARVRRTTGRFQDNPVSAVGQLGCADQTARPGERSHARNSAPVVKVAAVSVTAFMAASRELKPAWIRIEAERFIVPVSTAGTARPSS